LLKCARFFEASLKQHLHSRLLKEREIFCANQRMRIGARSPSRLQITHSVWYVIALCRHDDILTLSRESLSAAYY